MKKSPFEPTLYGPRARSKRCTTCGVVKSIEHFASATDGRQGRQHNCRSCDATINRPGRNFKRDGDGKIRQHGIRSPKVKAALHEFFEGICPLCLFPMELHLAPGVSRRWSAVIEHDHETGFIRGMAHFSCNPALGQFDAPGHFRCAKWILDCGRHLELVKAGIIPDPEKP